MSLHPSSINPASLPSLPLTDRRSLPELPCIYFAIDSQGVIQYIGRSGNLRRRWAVHHRHEELEGLGGVNIAWLEVSDTSLLPAIEEALIDWFKPSLNRLVRLRVVPSTPKKETEERPTRIKWRLAAVMADRELNYKELAQLTGFHPATVNKHKNLRLMPSSIESATLAKYCCALRCQPGDLMVVYVEAKVHE